MPLQGPFSYTPLTINEMLTVFSAPRFTKYMNSANRNHQLAIKLYVWNATLSQSIYWPLQTLEISFRNSVSKVLSDKYGPDWHLNQKFHSILSQDDFRRLLDSINRQSRQRGMAQPTVDSVIADLSFGFWVALATRQYEVPLGWATRLKLAFPNIPQGVAIQSVGGPMNRLRDLRNRIAHHEPIFHLRLDIKYDEILRVLGWVNKDVKWMIDQTCTFRSEFTSRPR